MSAERNFGKMNQSETELECMEESKSILKKKTKKDETVDLDAFLISMEAIGIPCEKAINNTLCKKIFDIGMEYGCSKSISDTEYWKNKYMMYMQKKYVPKVLSIEYSACVNKINVPDGAYEIGGFIDGI